MRVLKITHSRLAPIPPARMLRGHMPTKLHITQPHSPRPQSRTKPASTRVGTGGRTTHNTEDSPHRADMTTPHTTQAPHKLRPPTHRRPSATQPNTTAHAPCNHTAQQRPLKASTQGRTERPESHIAHQARHTHQNLTVPHPRARPSPRLREPRPSPLGPGQAGPLYPVGLPRARRPVQVSGPPRFLTQPRTPSPSAARRSAGAPAAARKPEGRLSEERRVLDGRPAASAQAP